MAVHAPDPGLYCAQTGLATPLIVRILELECILERVCIKPFARHILIRLGYRVHLLYADGICILRARMHTS